MRDLRKRVATVFAATCAVQAVQTPFFWPAHLPVPPAFFLSHFLIVLVIQLCAAWVLGGRAQERGWAGAVFLLPVSFALYPTAYVVAQSHHAPGAFGALTVLGASAALWCAWVRFAPGPGAPLVCAALGAALGAWLLRFLEGSYRGSRTAPAAIVELVLVGLLGLGAAVFAGRLRVPALRPVTTAAAGFATLVGTLLLSPLDVGLRARPPSGVASSDARRPSVVLIVLDTVRADHLKSYGYETDTMPNLERFVRDHAVRVDRAIANGSWTLPTHASIFTGLHPPRHGAHALYVDDSDPAHLYYSLGPEPPTLAGLLSGAGYWTVGISANPGPLSPAFGLDRGFQLYRAQPDASYVMKRYTPWRIAAPHFWPLEVLDVLPPFSQCGFFGRGEPARNAREITNEAIAVLDAAGAQPTFLFLNYMEAHTPYRRHGASTGSLPPPDRVFGPWQKLRRQVLSGERSLTAQERSYLAALYDGELAYLDSHLARLLERLTRHPLWQDMLVIVTSDHGEAFGEHGLLEHGVGLYQELLRVPLFVKLGAGTPDAPPPGSTVERVMESVDLFPLVLAHAGVALPEGIDGIAWGGERSEARAWLYKDRHNASIHPERFDRQMRSIERDGWKLIESSNGDHELYELRGDPAETIDLAVLETELRSSLQARLGPEERRHLVSVPDRLEEGTLEQLRALGYVGEPEP